MQYLKLIRPNKCESSGDEGKHNGSVNRSNMKIKINTQNTRALLLISELDKQEAGN